MFALVIGMATVLNSFRQTAVSYQRLTNKFIARSTATIATPILKEKPPNVDIDSERQNAKSFKEIPGTRSVPILGTSWVFLIVIGHGIHVSHEFELLKLYFKNFGPIWKDSFPGIPQFVSTVRPEDAETVFRADGKLPGRPGLESLKMYRAKRIEHFSSGGIMVDNGESWWQIRSKAQPPLLKSANFSKYLPVLGQISDEFIDRIRLIRMENNEMPEDFSNEMYRWALESVAVVGLNTRLGCLEPNMSPESDAQKMIDATYTSFSLFFELEFLSLPFWKYFMTPTLRKLFAAQDVITETSVKYIRQTLESIKNKKPDSEDELSVLEQLLIRGMTLREATVMVTDMLMAGIDTTSNTTAFLIYLLARNPEKQRKLRDEIHAVVGTKGSPVSSHHLNELPYLKACIKESLRLRPAVVGNMRTINQDLVLSGYHVPKGTVVRLLHQLTGQLEEFFPDAQKFLPERWIKGDVQESHNHPYALLPFGFGPRMCIGRRLAELEMWQFTIKLLQNFDVQYHHKDIGWLTRAVNTPDQSLRFKFIELK